jgi:tripartite-type tricarboxylate transporter receptor subunit TctC
MKKILYILALLAPLAWADQIKLVVPYGPGGGTDSIARAVSKSYSDATGTTVVVENRAGANTVIGTDYVLSSEPNGTTLLISSPNVISSIAATGQEVSFNWKQDLTPVAYVGTSLPFVLVVNKNLNITTLKQLNELAKTRPLSYATAGAGQPHHVYAEILRKKFGTEFIHIPYKSSAQTVVDTLSGQVDMMFTPMSVVRQHIASGNLVPIMVTGKIPLIELANVPTATSLGISDFNGYDVNYTIYASSKLPAATLKQLSKDFSQAYQAALPGLIERDLADPRHAVPTDLNSYMMNQSLRWNAKTLQIFQK